MVGIGLAGTLTAHAILGVPNDLKLRSRLTLLAAVRSDEALATFYDGKPDPDTLKLLERS